MTTLRDARLQRALDHAPDAALQPAMAVRDAIHRAAHQAVRPPVVAPTAAWWTRLWTPSVKPGMPWNAAFASLLLASMVTLLWHNEEVPDATPQAASPVAAPAAPPAKKAEQALPPLAVPAPVQRTEPAVAAAPLEQKKAAPAPPAAPPTLAQRRSEAAADVPTAAPVAPAAMTRPEAADSARAARGAAAERDIASVAAPSPPAPVVAAPLTRTARPANVVQVPAPAPVAEPPTGRSAATAKAQGALADNAEQRERSAFAPLLPPVWTEARIVQGSRQWSVAPGNASMLADLLRRLAAGAPVSGSIAAADVTIVLLHNGQVLGQLELAGDALLWTAAQGGVQHTTSARPDAALRDALRAEIARLGAAQ